MPAIFDCNIGVGKTVRPVDGVVKPTRLLEIMDRYTIAEALIYDLDVIERGRFIEYEWILKFCEVSDRLHPSVPLVPPECGENPPLDEMIKNGVRAVRLYPVWHRFDFLPYCLDSLLSALEKRRIPVFYSSYHPAAHPFEHRPEWDQIARTAEQYPKLPIVVLYTGMLQNRRIFPLLRRFENIKVDISCQTFGFVEYVAEKFGADRLVFGSCFPEEEPGLHIMPVLYSRLDPEDHSLLAGGNILELLNGVNCGD